MDEMTNAQRGSRGIWTVVAILAGMQMIIRAGGETTTDAVVAVASAFLVLLAVLQVMDAERR
jgi:hypothetical protein